MPTFFDSAADAAEASEALRGLAHASRTFDEPAQMYGVIGDLSSGMRSLRQVLEQLADVHERKVAHAFDDDGDHAAGVRDALATAEELRRSARLVDQAYDRLAEGFVAAGRIAWHPEPAVEETVPSRWITVVFLQGDEADRPLRILGELGHVDAVDYLAQWDYGEETTQAALENGYVYDEPGEGTNDRVMMSGDYALVVNPHVGYVSLLRRHPDPDASAEAIDEPSPTRDGQELLVSYSSPGAPKRRDVPSPKQGRSWFEPAKITGGTNGKAPIGYLNIRTRDELGRELRTIELDPERAPMIEWAFKAYASGDWSVSQLHDELTSRGLRSLPTPKRPAKPLAVSSVHRMLTNPYYKGDVVYRGTRYKGNHPAIVPAEVWYQVQSVLTAHQCAVEATQVHGHYLKGTIHCGQCGSRLIVSNAKNRHGNVYCYFVCSGRHSKRTDCTRQAMLIEDVEKLVEDYYKRVQITPAQQDALAGMLHHEFDRLMAAETEELERLTANRDPLEREQDRLMQAHYADAIPLSVLKREQDRLTGELDKVTRRIDAHYGDYADVRAHLDDALGLLANCADIYARCDDTNRRLCNQAFFTKVFIDEDNELRVERNRPFEMLLDPQVNANALTWAADADKARTATNIDVGKGSSLVRGVELRVLSLRT